MKYKMTYAQRIGRSLTLMRQQSGLSQEVLADKIGMHRTYYSAIERGEKNLTIRTLERIASAVKESPAEILRDAERPDI